MKIIKNNFIMIGYVIKFCPLYVLSAALYIASSSVLSLAEVLLIQRVIHLVMTSDNTTFSMIIEQILLYLIVLLVCHGMQILHQNYLQPRFRHVWVKKIQHVMFEKSAKLDISCFDDPKIYDLFSRALREGDIKGVNTFDTFVHFLRTLTITITLATYIVFQDPILLGIILVQSIFTFWLSSKISKMWYKVSKEQEQNQRRYSYIKRVFYMEKYTCDIKTTNLSNLLIENQIETKNLIDVGYRKTENKVFILRVFEDIFYQITRNFAGYLYLMWKVYYKSAFTIAHFSATINALFNFTGYFYGVIYSFVGLKENAMYIDDFLWLMKYQPRIEGKGGEEVIELHPTIYIDNVSFRYPNQENYVLKDVNLMLAPKEKIAIIGYNGAGKTTLIKLLLKFYEAETGKILIGNQDLNILDEQKIRGKYASIFQNFQIYSVSVLENILFRKRINEEDDKIVWDALEKSELADKIRLTKDGLDTILTKEFNDEGLVLSGGEKQKLAIARVFASPSPIIILDEPTSSLDPLSEYEINKGILNLCKEKTVIIISHRLSTVVDASKIYMFDNGVIVESGSHYDLMKMRGKYFEMFETQAKLYKEKMVEE